MIKYVIMLITICLSAFFSGTELSMTAVNKLRLQKLAEEGDKRAALALKISIFLDKLKVAVNHFPHLGNAKLIVA